ncbi:MAG: hypothetical protein HY647_12555 [Acidobacteria bacterium]|nr:hypothetical protein [Acidobacteriota bacterium]
MLPREWPDFFFPSDSVEERLPTIALVNLPHPQIPDLYQRCYAYVEPWQWSPEVELVETGQWLVGPESEETKLS